MDPLIQYVCLFFTGIVSGTVSGLFGVGGGSLMTPVQFWLYTSGGMDSTLATRLAFGTSLAVIIPTMISGAYGHHHHGAVDWRAAVPLGFAAIFGGLIGGMVASHISGQRAPAVLCGIYSHHGCPHGLANKGMPGLRAPWNGLRSIFSSGFFIGILSGLTGLGGGALLVPILVILLGYPIHRGGRGHLQPVSSSPQQER